MTLMLSMIQNFFNFFKSKLDTCVKLSESKNVLGREKSAKYCKNYSSKAAKYLFFIICHLCLDICVHLFNGM